MRQQKETKVEIKKLHLMPCAAGVCQECGRDHEPWEPHDLSMYFLYKFHEKEGRFPTWTDAMAHCSDEVKQTTIEVLREHGVVLLGT